MYKYLLHIVLVFLVAQQMYAQENGVVGFDLPVRNSLKFNRYAINPTFSFIREQNKYLSFTNKKQWVQFDNAPQTYLLSYSGRFRENSGIGVGFFQQDYGVLTTFGGLLNYAYNAVLGRDSNLTFGMNLGFYQSGINQGKVITNFADPSLEDFPTNALIAVNPGLNYGTGFFDFGLSINNLFLYNFQTSKLVEDNPKQGVQAHIMYTGYVNSRGFFYESKFSGLIRSEFNNDKTVLSGIMMLTVPKGIWGQIGYNTLYGASAGIGVNISKEIALEYNYEQEVGEFSAFGNSHEITLAYKFKNTNRFSYSGDDEEEAIFNSNKRSRRTVVKPRSSSGKKVVRKSIAEENKRKLANRAAVLAEKKAKTDAQEIEATEVKLKEARVKEEEARLKQEAKDRAKKAEEAKAKIEEENIIIEAEAQRVKLLEEEKARVAEAARVKEEEEEKARIKKEAEIKAKADEESRIKLEEEAKAKEAQETRIKLEEEARLKQEAKDRAKKAEETRVKLEEEAKTKLEEENIIKEAEAQRVKLLEEEKARVAEEARIKQEEEEKARIKKDAEIKAKADEESRIKLEEEVKEKEDKAFNIQMIEEDAIVFPFEKDEDIRKMNDLTKLTVDSRIQQQELLIRLREKVDSKQKDLDDLKEENDLGEQGIFRAPKPFKSISAENATLELLKSEINNVIIAQNRKINKLEVLYNDRLRATPDPEDSTNIIYLKNINELKTEQYQTIKLKNDLLDRLEEIKLATEIERKRRIKRADYDNQEDRYIKDREALNQIKQSTPKTEVPLKVEDFDFGEERSNNIQIMKDVKNVESGYYLILAVHNDITKRDEFLTKVLSTGQGDIDFFFDVNTSKYYIYQLKYKTINEARNSMLSNKDNQPYNNKVSIVKIEN